MKHYLKNGIDFVTDLVWQKQTDVNKVNLKNYRLDCKFELFCKTNRLATTFGFGRLPKDDNDKPLLKANLLVSLALYIIESVEVDAEADQFICFKFEDADKKENCLYGYILLFRGTVLAESGEFIGSLREVESRIEQLAKKYGIKVAFVPEDVPFYNNTAFATRAGLDVFVIKSNHDKSMPASDQIFWSKEKKKKVSLARLKPLVAITKNTITAIALLSVTILIGLGYYVKEEYFSTTDLDDIPEAIAPKALPTAFAPNQFINKCFAKFDKLLIDKKGWSTNSFRCSAKGIDVSYSAKDGKWQDLIDMTSESGIVFNQQSASLHLNLDFTQLAPLVGKQTLITQVDSMNSAADLLKFNATINNSQFDIQGKYSPVFLYENGIINNVNLSEVSMNTDANGFFNWDIKGELNGKK